MTVLMSSSCTCAECQALCSHKPGWFIPGEVEKVAEFLSITLQELFDRHLMPDSWELDTGSILTLSPAIKGTKPGTYLSFAGGECVFFEAGRCSIHGVKPYECRMAGHIHSPTMHEEAAMSWVSHQAQIADLERNNLKE